MNTELMGITRAHAMRLAAELTISGSVDHIVELLQRAQVSALVAVHGVQGAQRILSDQAAPIA